MPVSGEREVDCIVSRETMQDGKGKTSIPCTPHGQSSLLERGRDSCWAWDAAGKMRWQLSSGGRNGDGGARQQTDQRLGRNCPSSNIPGVGSSSVHAWQSCLISFYLSAPAGKDTTANSSHGQIPGMGDVPLLVPTETLTDCS